MTLIAMLAPAGVPTFIGDLLLSRGQMYDNATTEHFPLPTVGPGKLDPNNKTKLMPEVTGLVQKICVPRDCLLIAWSGTVIAARAIISDLLENLDASGYSIEVVRHFFQNPAYREINEQSFIISLVKNRNVHLFWQHAEKRKSKSFGDIVLAGSGAPLVTRYIDQLDNSPAMEVLRGGSEHDPKAFSFMKSLSITALLMGRESHTGDSLASFFGGGFEIATIVKNRFSKVNGITYMFWSYSETVRKENKGIVLMPFIIKTCYVGELLVVRRLWWPEDLFPIYDAADFSHPPNDLLLAVPPIVAHPDIPHPSTIELPKLNSEWVCHYVFIENNRFAVLSSQNIDGSLVRFLDDRIEITPNFMQTFSSYINRIVQG